MSELENAQQAQSAVEHTGYPEGAKPAVDAEAVPPQQAQTSSGPQAGYPSGGPRPADPWDGKDGQTQHDPGAHTQYVDIRTCARCGGNHPGLTFIPFNEPVECGLLADGSAAAPITHWAICPVTSAPVLMVATEDDEATDVAAAPDEGTA